MLSVYLMHERLKGDASFWAPYLRVLPHPGSIADWTSEELAELQHRHSAAPHLGSIPALPSRTCCVGLPVGKRALPNTRTRTLVCTHALLHARLCVCALLLPKHLRARRPRAHRSTPQAPTPYCTHLPHAHPTGEHECMCMCMCRWALVYASA